MYVKLLIFFLVYNFTSNPTFSQKNLERVEIVLADGKSLKGLIEFKSEHKNLDYLKFYKSSKSEMRKIYPIEVERFSVSNHQYFSAQVDIETSPIRKRELDNNKVPNMENKMAFLMKVIEGPKSLYYHKAKNGKEQFYIPIDGKFVPLIHKYYAEYFGTVIRMKENRFYIGQLIKYLHSDEWNPDFTSYTYTYDKMKELFLFYYRAHEIEPAYVDTIEEKRKRKKRS